MTCAFAPGLSASVTVVALAGIVSPGPRTGTLFVGAVSAGAMLVNVVSVDPAFVDPVFDDTEPAGWDLRG